MWPKSQYKKQQLPRKLRIRIFERDQWRCWFCGIKTKPASLSSMGDVTNATVEHLEPESLGGSNDESNLVTACTRCNAQKKNKTIEQYRNYLRYSVNPTGQAICHLSLAATLSPVIATEANKLIFELERKLPQIVFFGETLNGPEELT